MALETARRLVSEAGGALRDDLMELPCRLVDQGGPTPGQDGAFLDWLDRVDALVGSGEVAAEAIVGFWRSLGPDYLAGCLQGHALAKPHGYPGDFEMMEKIYGHHVTGDPRFQHWDRFFQQQTAPIAVRNRARYFSGTVGAMVPRGGRSLRILDLGCGPAVHLAALGGNPELAAEILCLDYDAHALERASLHCRELSGRVRFEQANVLRFVPRDTYDLIWSSGLFDYLSDASFVRIGKRFRAALRPGGEMVIGNFGVGDRSRPYMELVGDWRLHYRSEADLFELAAQIGAGLTEARVGREGTGLNLFLHIGADAGA